ncbi:MAG: UDP-3-O-acyl-N-acetylglucosamine deacetylase [Verrucomicrobia bacterium]|nr:UDP-3-O-acyl-N-acetylglucosamine deacetylase [Verrucomicrobiota bacterium]MBS0647142.1 UDP-3-O-acyl-N-acetylglucosamine deacetylase [Verrucomicrobiota bacterium]
MHVRPQRTLNRKISFSGIGIHTGKKVTLTFQPASENSGLVFQRLDLPGQPIIPAAIEYVVDTSRSTTLGIGGCVVHTVEHVLAALHAYHIDNLLIQLTDCEPPIGDGSSRPFVHLIEAAGIAEQSATRCIETILYPIAFSQGSIHLVALPSTEYRISYTLHYPKTPVIRSQYLSMPITTQTFKDELSMCRTFALYEEITWLMEKGLIRGGNLDNAVVIKDDVILSKEGLRFADEMVRHKILDLVGDLSLVGFPFFAHIIAICSGHQTNVALGKLLMESMTTAGQSV